MPEVSQQVLPGKMRIPSLDRIQNGLVRFEILPGPVRVTTSRGARLVESGPKQFKQLHEGVVVQDPVQRAVEFLVQA